MHSMIVILVIFVLFRCFAKKHFILKCARLVIKSGKSDSQCDVSYDNLLELRNSISIDQRELRLLLRKIYKSTIDTNPEFMWPFFKTYETQCTREFREFKCF